jgi:hypothetical protein
LLLIGVQRGEFDGSLESLRSVFTEKSLKDAEIAFSNQVWTTTLVVRMSHKVQGKLKTEGHSRDSDRNEEWDLVVEGLVSLHVGGPKKVGSGTSYHSLGVKLEIFFRVVTTSNRSRHGLADVCELWTSETTLELNSRGSACDSSERCITTSCFS